MTDDQLKRQAQIELTLQGNLNWMLHDIQREVKEKKDAFFALPLKERDGLRTFLINAFRGFGKTYFDVVDMVEALIKGINSELYPEWLNGQMMYAASVEKELSKYIYPTFHEVISRLPKECGLKLTVKGGQIHCSNTNMTCHVIGIDKNPNGARGNTLWKYTYDEMAFIDKLKYTHHSVNLPATGRKNTVINGRPLKDFSEMVGTTTPPESPDHYFKELAWECDKHDAYVKVSVYDDPSCTEEDIKQYKKDCEYDKEPTTFQREYECLFVTDDTKAVIPGFNLKRRGVFNKQLKTVPIHYNQHTSGDHGHKDQTGLIFGYYDFQRQKIVIRDSVSLINPLTKTIAKVILDKERELFGNHCLYRPIDSTPQVVADLCDMECIVHKVSLKKKMKDRMLRLRQYIDADMIEFEETTGNYELANELEYALWKDPLTKLTFERSGIYGHFDKLAALGYFIDTIDIHTNPTPNAWGLNDANMTILDVPNYNEDKGLTAIGEGFTKPDLGNDIDFSF